MQAPNDSPCSVCDGMGSTNSAEVGWVCATGAVQYDLPFNSVGVRTNYACKRVGQNTPATEAYWAPLNSGNWNVATAAVCCGP